MDISYVHVYHITCICSIIFFIHVYVLYNCYLCTDMPPPNVYPLSPSKYVCVAGIIVLMYIVTHVHVQRQLLISITELVNGMNSDLYITLLKRDAANHWFYIMYHIPTVESRVYTLYCWNNITICMNQIHMQLSFTCKYHNER